MKTVPGNSDYAKITRSGKKIMLMSSSICSRIKMRDFSKSIVNGYAYRHCHPGCNPKQMLHYCTYNLENDQPDAVIIHVGSNALGRDDSTTITNDILKIVDTCHSYGVNDVYVSGIIYRQKFLNQVYEINQILQGKLHLHDFNFISNCNINATHIWKDNLHLNDQGTKVLTDNFTLAINGARS